MDNTLVHLLIALGAILFLIIVIFSLVFVRFRFRRDEGWSNRSVPLDSGYETRREDAAKQGMKGWVPLAEEGPGGTR
jgi:hypothetical protein